MKSLEKKKYKDNILKRVFSELVAKLQMVIIIAVITGIYVVTRGDGFEYSHIFTDGVVTAFPYQLFLFTISTAILFWMFIAISDLKDLKSVTRSFDLSKLINFVEKMESVRTNTLPALVQKEANLAIKMQEKIVKDVIKSNTDIEKDEDDSTRVWIASQDLQYDLMKNMANIKKRLKKNIGVEYVWVVPHHLDTSTFEEGLAEDKYHPKSFHKVIKTEAMWMLTNDLSVYNYPIKEKPDNKEEKIFQSTFGNNTFIPIDKEKSQNLRKSLAKIIKNDKEWQAYIEKTKKDKT